MWTHEYEATTRVSPHEVWQVLSAVDDWASWDTSMEWVRLDGPFEVGSPVVMKPIGQDPITSTIAEIVPDQRYADETSFGGVTLRFSHTLHPAAAGTRVVHRLEITGGAADQVGPELGPAITEDFPEAMAGLLDRAAG
jgi:uncharacterized protein YndB with AHSA1/START domain